MTVLIDPILLVIFSGAMFFCSGFATYGCYRCYTDLDASKVVPEGNNLGNRSRDRYRLRLFRRRPSTASSDATIYSVHSSEIWSRRSSPGLKGVLPSPLPSPFMRPNSTKFVTPTLIQGWTIKEEPEEESLENRRNSAPT